MRALFLAITTGLLLQCNLNAAEPLYLADEPGLLGISEQPWGLLGLNTAAHQQGIPGEPLRIGTKNYKRGLGSHASGRIVVPLEGACEAFDAEVGIQPCAGGTVIFKVVVDGETRFESPIMRSGDEPRAVHVDLKEAQELSLETLDAGDGISCDMANWSEARLTPAAKPIAQRAAGPSVDIARFARVVTWDPSRTNGAQANRVQEFRAEDLFTETEMKRNDDGTFTVPEAAGQPACIGLQWLEQRHLRELEIEFSDPYKQPNLAGVRLESWFGESAWQGDWKPVLGELRQQTGKLVFTVSKRAPVQTRKVRWILPQVSAPAKVRLTALSRSYWVPTNVVVECAGKPGKGSISIYNGELLSPSKEAAREQDNILQWNTSKPMRISLLHSGKGMFSEGTLLRFQLPSGHLSVAVADVLANDGVYLPEAGLFVTRSPAPISFSDYKRVIDQRRTVLEEVCRMPEQTRERAMENTHHDYQRMGPVLISLAADNSKFVVERDGAVRFQPTPFDWSRPYHSWTATSYYLRPKFGSGRNEQVVRKLDSDWLPIPVISLVESGIRYTQRTFVAPLDAERAMKFEPSRSVCVVEITAANEGSAPATATLSLGVGQPDEKATAPNVVTNGSLPAFEVGSRTVAVVEQQGTKAVQPRVSERDVSYEVSLAPGEKMTTVVWLLADNVKLQELPGGSSTAKLRQCTESYWKSLLDQATQIVTPDEWLNAVIRSSQVRCLIAARNESGNARFGASCAAMAYGPLESESHSVIRGMDFLGHSEFAKRSLDFFIHRYNTNGFLTTGYTIFGTAWHLWTVGEHLALTRDKEWLRKNTSEFTRVSHWIVRQMDKTRQLDAEGNPVPEYGLMPPGVLADWNAFAYHFAMNGYYAAALREMGQALGTIGHPDATLFLTKAEELRKNTLRAYRWTQSRAPALPLRDGTWIHYYPSQVHSPGKLADFFPGQDAGRSWCYDVELGAHQLVPTGVLSPGSREVVQIMDHMEDVQFLADGWFDYPATENRNDWYNLGGFSKVQPYYTRNAEIYAMRDDVKPFIRSYFNTLAAMISPEVMTFWEHFHNVGAYDKTHETGYFLHQTRTMLVQERGEELWLAPFIPEEWLKNGRRLTVRNAPTRFGAVSYEIDSQLDNHLVEAKITSFPQQAKTIVLRLRHPDGERIRSVILDGKRLRTFDSKTGIVRLRAQAKPAVLRMQFAP